MGHCIRKDTYSTKVSKQEILEDCNYYAQRESDYEDAMNRMIIDHIRFTDRTFDNYTDAEDWIDEHDTGWYDNLAVKYKDKKGNINWLVKYEFHV